VRDHTAVYVAPVFDMHKCGSYCEHPQPYDRIVSWRYEVLHNNKLVAHGEGYSTIEEAHQAGKEEHVR